MGITDSAPGQWLPIDALGARITIDYPHHEIHEGNHFTCSYSKALSAGSVLSVNITTPTSGTGYIHYIAIVESNLSGTWVLGETSSVSGGSALDVYNNNRGSTTTSGAVIVGTPTVTTYGTVIETHVMGSNSGPSRTGGAAEIRGEYILATDTSYIVYFTANATSTFSCITSSFYLA